MKRVSLTLLELSVLRSLVAEHVATTTVSIDYEIAEDFQARLLDKLGDPEGPEDINF